VTFTEAMMGWYELAKVLHFLGWLAAVKAVVVLAALVGVAFTAGVRRQRDALGSSGAEAHP
jgi:hypothetical protein